MKILSLIEISHLKPAQLIYTVGVHALPKAHSTYSQQVNDAYGVALEAIIVISFIGDMTKVQFSL